MSRADAPQREMAVHRAAAGGRAISRHQLSYDAGWRQGLVWYGAAPRGYFRMGHTGGDFGMSTRMFFRPDTRVGVVTLTNSSLGGRDGTRFGRSTSGSSRSSSSFPLSSSFEQQR